ncbi:MAG TPA: hypothetical protein VNY33_02835 [Gaiellaceae bacterium]|jgi:hypothetical protein|nr:hypothetical protein [Gaiellaceae bacterium]
MANDLPPGTGVFKPGDPAVKFTPGDHMTGWNHAIAAALVNFGRSPGNYDAKVELSATVEVKNPGSVVEYIAKFI